MKKKRCSSKIKIARVLESLAEEKSASAVAARFAGLNEDDVWAAVAEAGLLIGGDSGRADGDGIYKLNIDGSAIPNPGAAGIGIVICDPAGKTVRKLSKYIGQASNNVAEYTALIEGMKEVLKLARSVRVCSDSELLVRQLNGQYRVKDDKLQEKVRLVRELEKEFDKISYNHVLRKYNSEADGLANSAAKKKR